MKIKLRISTLFYLFLLPLLLAQSAIAQEYFVTKKMLTIEDGISSTQLSSVYEDSKGFVWIGMNRGVDRYDGDRIQHFALDSLDNSGELWINHIVEDVSGSLWLSFQFAQEYHNVEEVFFKKILILNSGLGKVKTFEEQFPSAPFQTIEIKNIHQDENKVLWFVLSNNQVWIFDGAFSRQKDENPLGEAISVCPSSTNTFWIGEKNLIREVDINGHTIQQDTLPALVTNHWVDKKGVVWILTAFPDQNISDETEHFFYVKRPGESVKPFFENLNLDYDWLSTWGMDVKEDLENRLWVNAPEGMIVINKSGDLIYDFSSLSNKSNEGRNMRFGCFSPSTVWMKTSESDKQGLVSVNLTKNVFRQILKEAPKAISTRGISRLNDSLIVIGSYGGIYFWNVEHNKKESFPLAKEVNYSYGHTQDQWGNLISGLHSQALLKINTDGKWERDFFPVENINNFPDLGSFLFPFIDKRGKLWVGTTNGLAYSDEANGEYLKCKFPAHLSEFSDVRINTFFENAEGIWLGTMKGVFLLDPLTNMIQKLPLLSSYEVTFIHQDKAGVFWLGTTNDGLIKWDKRNEEIKQYSKSDGLSNNTIHAVFEDEYNCLWLSSNYGLMRFDKNKETVNSYFEEDGITYNEFNQASYFQDEDGTIYFGGINGVTAFYPKDFLQDHYGKKIKPIVTKFEKLDVNSGELLDQSESFYRENKITLKPDDKSFIVHFAFPDYSNSLHRRYAYKIEDLDEKWIPVQENFIRVNQLSHGDYNLKIRSMGRYGAWSDVLSIPINVVQAFYLQTWFIIASIIAALLAVFGFIRFRTYRLRRRAVVLSQEVFQRTKTIEYQKNELEESNRVKDKFLSLIAHDLRTPLSTLNSMSQKMDFLVKENRLDDVQKLSLSIDKSSANMTILLDNLLKWALLQKQQFKTNQKPLYVKSILENTIALYQSSAELKKIDFKICMNDELAVLADRNTLLTIFRNVIDNAIKYSDRHGFVKINASQFKNEVKIKIENSGSLITEESIENIFVNKINVLDVKKGSGLGLKICKELMVLNNGRFFIESKTADSTTVTLVLPTMSTQGFIGNN